MLRFVLPFPPSVNRYYRSIGYRTLLSREGRAYRVAVCALLAGRVGQPLSGLLEVQLDLFPPDARRRDWDNFQKGIWDSLQHAGVYVDDSQVKRAVIELYPPSRQSRAEVAIAPYIPSIEEDRPCPASFTSMTWKTSNASTPTTGTTTRTSSSKSRRPKGPKRSIRLTKRST
ncbi:MAG: RusA family crossover junction endodeoxyribonuclease [Planctomycetaceae bacterium]|nr:RusA family crossover junction endodeoxyribonuclease [Planctomycetaceae bacterium]